MVHRQTVHGKYSIAIRGTTLIPSNRPTAGDQQAPLTGPVDLETKLVSDQLWYGPFKTSVKDPHSPALVVDMI